MVDQSRRRFTALMLGGVVAGMGGAAYAAVPAYRLFCQVTGFGGATVGVSFPKYGVNCAAKDFGVAILDYLFRVVLRFIRIVRDSISLRLQFLDCGMQLWNGCADIG